MHKEQIQEQQVRWLQHNDEICLVPQKKPAYIWRLKKKTNEVTNIHLFVA